MSATSQYGADIRRYHAKIAAEQAAAEATKSSPEKTTPKQPQDAAGSKEK